MVDVITIFNPNLCTPNIDPPFHHVQPCKSSPAEPSRANSLVYLVVASKETNRSIESIIIHRSFLIVILHKMPSPLWLCPFLLLRGRTEIVPPRGNPEQGKVKTQQDQTRS